MTGRLERPGGRPRAVQLLFTERLASPHTVTVIRNSFRLLLRFAAAQPGKSPGRVGGW
jgi:hypothetical protein